MSIHIRTGWLAAILIVFLGVCGIPAGAPMYFAQGSAITAATACMGDQYLGFYLAAAYTSVRRTAPGYYAYGSCP